MITDLHTPASVTVTHTHSTDLQVVLTSCAMKCSPLEMLFQVRKLRSNTLPNFQGFVHPTKASAIPSIERPTRQTNDPGRNGG